MSKPGNKEEHIPAEEESIPTASYGDVDAGPGATIGHYKLLSILGEGGYGIVYLAEQQRPVKRRVALKVIKPGMDSRQVIARFEAERQALALLDHPNIAKVFDGGTTKAGRPYFVMECVKGIAITEHCDRHKLTVKERLGLFLQVCEAVQYAHQKGIIHRDIKPSNILVAIEAERVIPMIIDFGVTKAISQPLTERTLVTEQGQFVGTPEYMSPEQADLTTQDIDTRSDIYSLGVVLYELLTGVLPFDPQDLRSQGIEHIRRIISEEDPKTPSTRLTRDPAETAAESARRRQTDVRTLQRQLHGDLDWITLKAMDKDRTRRYQTAHALAEDIQRYLNQEPVLAGPPSTVYKLHKFVARNKRLVASVVVIAIILLLSTIISVSQMIVAKRAERIAEQASIDEAAQRLRAQTEELKARRRAYASDMNLAAQALDQDNLGRAQDLLDRHRPSTSDSNSVSSIDLRGWEWRYLWKQAQSDALYELCRGTREITSLSVSHDGRLAAVGGRHDDGASVWDLRTGLQVAVLHPEEHEVRLAFAPRESLLAFTGVPHRDTMGYPQGDFSQSCIRLWDARSREIVKEIPLGGFCVALQFSGDGKFLVSSTSTGGRRRITVWSIPDGEELRSYRTGQSGGGHGTPFVMDRDQSFAVHAEWNNIHAVNLSTGQTLWSQRAAGEGQHVSALAMTQDGKVLASGAGFSEPTIRLWDVASGREIGRLEGHRTWVGDLQFWPDGETMASASADQTIRIWDVSDPNDGKLQRTLHGHTAEVWRIALLPDSRTLISGAKDGSVYVWDTEKPPPDTGCVTLVNIAGWRFDPEGGGVLTLDRDGRVVRYAGPSFQQEQHLMYVTGNFNLNFTRFSPDNSLLAIGSYDGTVTIWNTESGSIVRSLTCPRSSDPVAFLHEETLLATVSRSEDSHDVWDIATGRRVASWPGAARLGGACSPAFSPDERWSLTLGRLRSAGVLRDMRTGQVTHPVLNISQTSGIAFSPGGQQIAASSFYGIVKLWKTETLQEVAILRGYGYLQGGSSVAFSPDGKRLAAGLGGLETVKIWDVDSHQELLTLYDQGALYCDTSFSPDGNILGSMNNAGRLKIWQAPSWEQIEKTEASTSRKKTAND
jgi:WD40 repeat protein/serine/threonine protein kinase